MSTLRFTRHASVTASAIAVLSATVLALTGCAPPATGGPAPADDNAVIVQSPPSGEVVGQGVVIDIGGEVEFCLGAVRESSPPQCDGIPITDWSWDGMGGFETSGDTTWGAYALVGTYDGESFAPTQTPISLALFDPPFTKDPTGGVEGTTDNARLEEIQRELLANGAITTLGTSIDRGYLWVQVTWDDGTLQRAVDKTYGPGVIIVQSALRPMGERSQIDK